MQTLSSARRTHMAPLSASEWTATVEMPISLHARWTRSAISPRLAIRIFSNMGGPPLLEDQEAFAELDRLASAHQDRRHLARAGRGDRGHGLHGLDDQQGLALRDLVARLHERVRAR